MSKDSEQGIVRLSKKDRQLIIDLYSSDKPRKQIQEELAFIFGVKERQIRKYAKFLGINQLRSNVSNDKVLIYDIETCRLKVDTWWTGKQYINHGQLRSDAKIISIAWKWLGEDEVYSLTWDKNHCDKKMITAFLKEYNKASMVVEARGAGRSSPPPPGSRGLLREWRGVRAPGLATPCAAPAPPSRSAHSPARHRAW